MCVAVIPSKRGGGPFVDHYLMVQIKNTAHFSNDLGLDSLDTVEVVMAIEEVRKPCVR